MIKFRSLPTCTFLKVNTIYSDFAGFLIVLGIIIFAAKFVEESNAITEMHYGLSVGFGLCVASGVLSFVTGILYIASSFRNRRH